MMDDNPSSPALLILDENNSRITSIPQFMSPQFFEVVLSYFNEDKYKTTSFQDFQKTFIGKVK